MWTAPLNVVRFGATTLWHFDAEERAPSTTSDSVAPVTGCRDRYTSNTGLECGRQWQPFRAMNDILHRRKTARHFAVGAP